MSRRRILTISLSVLYSGALLGQSAWPSYPNNTAISVSSAGNVGIGTTAPTAPLSIASSAGGVRVNYWVDVKSSACGLARIGQNVYLDYYNTSHWANTHPNIGGSLIQMGVCSATGWNDILFFRATGTTGSIPTTAGASAPMTESMRITSAGSVGIGTATPQHLLHVAGTIGAEEVIVSSTGADYVFDRGYHLRPLAEVANYVKQNHRLPEVPSAKEMQEKGASVGDMQTKLLAKIEELTLYAIQAEERNRKLEERVAELERQVVEGRGK
jgi:hypothetical protein